MSKVSVDFQNAVLSSSFIPPAWGKSPCGSVRDPGAEPCIPLGDFPRPPNLPTPYKILRANMLDVARDWESTKAKPHDVPKRRRPDYVTSPWRRGDVECLGGLQANCSCVDFSVCGRRASLDYVVTTRRL